MNLIFVVELNEEVVDVIIVSKGSNIEIKVFQVKDKEVYINTLYHVIEEELLLGLTWLQVEVISLLDL